MGVPAPGCATAGAERPVPEVGRVHRAIQREQESGLETRRPTVSQHPPKFSSGAAASNQVKVHHMYTDPYVKASGKSADAKELRRLQKRLAAVKKAHNTVHARRIEREIQALGCIRACVRNTRTTLVVRGSATPTSKCADYSFLPHSVLVPQHPYPEERCTFPNASLPVVLLLQIAIKSGSVYQFFGFGRRSQAKGTVQRNAYPT